MRKPDVLTRYGGDEFCMIIQDATRAHAEIVLARLKKGAEENLFQGLNGDGKFPVSISIGMVTYNDKFSSVEELMALADENMYRNKNGKPPSESRKKRASRRAEKSNAGS